MEQVAKCKSLVAIFRDDKKMLDGPHAVGFDIEKDKAFHIDVEQCGIRKISITSDVDVSVFDLYALFSRIERLFAETNVLLNLGILGLTRRRTLFNE